MEQVMKLTNIHGFNTIEEYIGFKLDAYSKEEKNFESLFRFMFDETDNVMVETSDGYRVKKITYGEFKSNVLAVTPTLCRLLDGVPVGETVGLYMSNCPEWLLLFWAILAAGYKPLLMNTRLSHDVLEGILAEYSVKCVISDSNSFSVRTVFKEEALVPSENAYEPRPFGTEVIFMSSGTSDNVKLCAYTGENFFYQVCDSASIVEQCPKIREHCDGELKQLVLLPLCHVFGFIAVYLWFGFFARTFVFPKDLSAETVQRTVKKHRVTHIFAVPMVWEAVYKAAMNKIKNRGEDTFKRFSRASELVNSLGATGDILAAHLLGQVREELFGDSIRFLISGGSGIRPEVLRFFNGIGYHLVNGYGMTEIGITSVERSGKRKEVNRASIGAPFGNTEYAIDETGTLLVRGRSCAAKIMQNGSVTITDPDEWFNTGDLMHCTDGRYYADGRGDDLIIGDDGENLNPTIAEAELNVNGTDGVCLFNCEHGVTLLVSVPGVYSEATLQSICEELDLRLAKAKLDGTVRRILFTRDKLMRGNEFKISRKKIAERVARGEYATFDAKSIGEHVKELLDGLEETLALCFAEALGIDKARVGRDDDFFRDLGGTSLDYFTLLKSIKTHTNVDFMANGDVRCTTVGQMAEYIKRQ